VNHLGIYSIHKLTDALEAIRSNHVGDDEHFNTIDIWLDTAWSMFQGPIPDEQLSLFDEAQ